MTERDQAEGLQRKTERDKADKEKLAALGYDAENPAVLAHFQELQDKVATGRITQREARRSMDRQADDLADKERRDAAKTQNEGHPRDRMANTTAPIVEAKTPKQDFRPTAREVTGREGPGNPPPIQEGEEKRGPESQKNTNSLPETQPSRSQKQEETIDWQRYPKDKEYRRQVNAQQRGQQQQQQQQQRPPTAQRHRGR